MTPRLLPMFKPDVSDRAVARVAEILHSGWLSEGPVVAAFERAFAAFVSAPTAVAVNSGTAALHLAIVLAGLRPGDEIVTSPQTFVATAQAALMHGLRVVFADIQRDTGNIDPVDIPKRLSERTRAVLPVHYGGYPCDMDEIHEIADRHGLEVIEDAAHALGASYKQRPVGSLSRFTAFSFQAIKHITTGDGGMLAVAQDNDGEKARRLRWFGLERTPRAGTAVSADITEIGFKYHMNDVAAGLGQVQLEDFPPRLTRRQTLNRIYRDRLHRVPGVQLLKMAADRTHAVWLFTVLVERRGAFIDAMRSRGVEAGVWHERIDRYSVCGGVRADLAGVDYFTGRQVCLPLRDTLTDDEVELVLRSVERGW